MVDFYPRSPCGERRNNVDPSRNPTHISIHALLAESDTQSQIDARVIPISIHALLAESDLFDDLQVPASVSFLSTLSLRRATKRAVRGTMRAIISIHALLAESDNTGQPVRGLPSYFYPRSPCGERPGKYIRCVLPVLISIHALLAESDCPGLGFGYAVRISIHALLAESDGQAQAAIIAFRHFYPRSPCGERRAPAT